MPERVVETANRIKYKYVDGVLYVRIGLDWQISTLTADRAYKIAELVIRCEKEGGAMPDGSERMIKLGWIEYSYANGRIFYRHVGWHNWDSSKIQVEDLLEIVKLISETDVTEGRVSA